MAVRKQFLLRMDPVLWSDLEVWAQEELRSVNGQVEYLLREAIQKRKKGRPALGAARGANEERPGG